MVKRITTTSLTPRSHSQNFLIAKSFIGLIFSPARDICRAETWKEHGGKILLFSTLTILAIRQIKQHIHQDKQTLYSLSYQDKNPEWIRFIPLNSSELRKNQRKKSNLTEAAHENELRQQVEKTNELLMSRRLEKTRELDEVVKEAKEMATKVKEISSARIHRKWFLGGLDKDGKSY